MKTVITILICGFGASSFGQTVSNWTANSTTKYYVSNNGTFFNNPLQNPPGGFIVPKDSMVSSIHAMCFMAAGSDFSGNLKGAVANYQTSDFSPGPYLPVVANYSSQSYISKYGSALWNISKSQIDHHMAHWMDPGYVVPGIIASWPGNGDSGNGESLLLAPFYDSDGDQLYEPEDGDYPLIRGDKAIYTIINDGKHVHPSGFEKIGLEVHMLFYQYDVPSDNVLTNTVFFQTTIFNRGTSNLQNFHAGHLIDFDLGNPFDDYTGTDPGRHLAYIYNGDAFDGTFSGNPGFGAMPPAAGIINLDGSMHSHILLPNGMVPTTGSQYYNTLKGLLPDGSEQLDKDLLPTPYIYSDIDSASGWNEYNGPVSNIPGERRSVIGQSEESFGPGKVLCYNSAAIFARKYESGMTASVDSLLLVADYIQDFYDQQDFYCETQFLSLKEHQDLQISLFPNPANDRIQIRGIDSGTFRIVNLEGKEILNGSLETPVIQTESLKNGFYILEITSGGKHGRRSFVKE